MINIYTAAEKSITSEAHCKVDKLNGTLPPQWVTGDDASLPVFVLEVFPSFGLSANVYQGMGNIIGESDNREIEPFNARHTSGRSSGEHSALWLKLHCCFYCHGLGAPKVAGRQL
ncbi:hypothetical protein EAE99_011434 [Botrytis elliptica]|nr:hypothetical protein EAE99_011434 [Botrytis elliptica]